MVVGGPTTVLRAWPGVYTSRLERDLLATSPSAVSNRMVTLTVKTLTSHRSKFKAQLLLRR
jgi:hypothetical protein